MTIYLHRDPVDFRKSINGLSVTVDEAMGLSPPKNTAMPYLYIDKTRCSNALALNWVEAI